MFFKRFFSFVFAASVAFAPTLALGAGETLALNNATDIPPAEIAAVPPAAPAAAPSDAAASPSVADMEVPKLIPATSLGRDDLWQRIRSGFALNDLNSPLIARHEQWYAGRPDYVARMTERAQRYLYYITEEVEKRGMPTEIALLPMIESAFNPGAYSTGRAAGIWQFIPSTAKNFGLQRNWWYDGRRDVISATQSALDYLQKLHDQFGDWELALAAYNWGEGAVERAVEYNRRRGLATDYASLRMPEETRNYIPKLLAIKNIVNDPERFGLALHPIPNQPYFAAVSTGRHIDVKLAAKLADISQDEFDALNPAHNRPVILQDNDDVLLLPVDKADTFRANLENYTEPLVSWQAYQSKKGERLDRLAPRFGLSVERLKAVNGLSPRTKLSNGQTLLVPARGETDDEFEAFNTHLVPSEPLPAHAVSYTVRKGDTLKSIARRHHVSVARLKSWNDGVAQVKPGQTLALLQGGGKRHTAGLHTAKARHTPRLAGAKGRKQQVARKSPRNVQPTSYRYARRQPAAAVE